MFHRYYECSKRREGCKVRALGVNGNFRIIKKSPKKHLEHLHDKNEVADRRFKGHLFELTQNKFAEPQAIYNEGARNAE